MIEDTQEVELEGGDVRLQRDQDTREVETREDDTFVPAGLLPEIKQKDGYHYRWIRLSSSGSIDAANMTSRFKEGYVPVPAAEHPEVVVWKDPNSRFPEGIEQGGLLLCRIPEARAEARRRYFRDKAESQAAAVDNNFMRENDRRMPLFSERRSGRSNSP